MLAIFHFQLCLTLFPARGGGASKQKIRNDPILVSFVSFLNHLKFWSEKKFIHSTNIFRCLLEMGTRMQHEERRLPRTEQRSVWRGRQT